MFSLGLIIEFPLFGRFLKGIMNGSHAKSNFGVKLQWRFCIYGTAFVNYSKKTAFAIDQPLWVHANFDPV